MAPDVERLPAKQNSIGAKVLRDLFRVEGVKLLAVFPVKQFGVFRLQKPAWWSKRHVPLSLIEPGHALADGYGLRMLRAFGEIGSRNHVSPRIIRQRIKQHAA